jgi:hypothetical protein
VRPKALSDVARPKHIKSHPKIPSLNKRNNDVTSDDDPLYNCVAFAAGVTNRKWWPVFHPDFYWPPSAPKINSIMSFVTAFSTLGYAECDDGAVEAGFEKIAFYVRDGQPTHAARQLETGKWKSKLGDWYDIEHTENAVSSGDYGRIAKYMRRPRRG